MKIFQCYRMVKPEEWTKMTNFAQICDINQLLFFLCKFGGFYVICPVRNLWNWHSTRVAYSLVGTVYYDH